MKRILLAALILTAGCQKETPKVAANTEPAPARVPVLRIEARPFTSSVPVTGSLVSRALVDVKAETTGRVLSFPKQEGESVAAGEPLVWVNDADYKLGIRQAKSGVQVAEAAVERAKILAAHASSERERADNLIQSGGITDKDLKATRIAEQDARAQVALAEAQLDQARAALEVADKRQRDTVIYAPVSGEIRKRYVNPGAYVEPPTPVFSLVDNARLELEAPVPTSELAPLRPGQKVAFRVNAFPGQSFAGRVADINPAVDPSSRAATVRIAVQNSGARLKAGMFVEGEILTGVENNAVVIPAAAVYRDDRSAKTSFVYVVEKGKAVRRNVTIRRERGSELEIAEGLAPGETLVAAQSIEIADGTRVEPRR